MSVSEGVPIFDLAAWHDADASARAVMAAAVDRALCDIGFLLVTGHGIPSEVFTDARAQGKEFFSQDRATKSRYAVSPGGRGWIGPGVEANGYSGGVETPPDLKESFAMGQTLEGDSRGYDDMYGQNSWPAEVPGLQPVVQSFADHALALADRLLAVFAAALHVPESVFLDACSHAPYFVNVTRYPALSDTGPVQEGQFRIGPHTDFGTLTILDRQPGRGGLQIQQLDGTWVDAPYVEGALTINIGDLMARWTGGRWRSTPHRVLPPDTAVPQEELISLVFFHEADPWYLIETLPGGGGQEYEPVRAGDFLRQQLQAITVAS